MQVQAYEFVDDCLYLLDQRKLPQKEVYFACHTYQDVHFAIREMVTRGAPLIGAAAAYGVVLACKAFKDEPAETFYENLQEALHKLAQARPTAVNLFWALNKMEKSLKGRMAEGVSLEKLYQTAKRTADEIAINEQKMCEQIALAGNEFVPQQSTILTHCNTGALATTGIGTALGIIRKAHYHQKGIQVYVDETRPRLQGSKLTCWELQKEGITHHLIPDAAAATLIRDNVIDLILVGADRIAVNGDVANKIGTFMLSVLAKAYKIPLYVAAPVSTIDFNVQHGSEITIEERQAEEVIEINGTSIAPYGTRVYNPAFDITPAQNITGIITQYGVITPGKESIKRLERG